MWRPGRGGRARQAALFPACGQGTGLSGVAARALQWSGNPYGNGYGLEMDGNGAQFVKMLWIGLDLEEGYQLKTIQ